MEYWQMIGFSKRCSIALIGICLHTQCFSQNIDNELDFIGLTHEIGWRAWVSYFRNAQNNDLIPCLNDGKFDESIFKIMAQGIRDCACKRGRFSEQNKKVATMPGRQLELIDFDADPESFKQGEWNVMLLYNYLQGAMHVNASKFTIYQNSYDQRVLTNEQKRLNDIKDNLIVIYHKAGLDEKKLKTYLEQAYREIDGYAQSLRLYQYLHEYRRKIQQNGLIYAPNVGAWDQWNATTKSGQFRLNNAHVVLEGQITPTILDVVVEDGQIVRYKMWDQANKFDSDENLIGKFRTFKENFKLDKNFIDKQFKDKLLSRTQIHNLRNFGRGNVPPIVQGNCYVNSVLQALHASATVRENVQRLNKVKDKTRLLNIQNISPILTDIFEAIEKGGMERHINGKDSDANLKRYSQAMTNLANCLEQNNAYFEARTSDEVARGPTPVKNKYNEIYTQTALPHDACVRNQNCIRGMHTIRQTGVFRATDTLYEIVEALTIEAQEHGIEPIVSDKIKKQRKTGEIIEDRTEAASLRYSIIGIQNDATECMPKSQTLRESTEYLPRINDIAEERIQKPQVAPIQIAQHINEKAWNHQLRAYEEIAVTVYGKKHKYRLVASVDYPGPGHFVASVLTKEGWVRINDTDRRNYTVLHKYEEIPTNETPWGAYRNIVIYEPVY